MNSLIMLKQEYNHNLSRYYNGCNYLSDNPEKFDQYIGELEKIKENINSILEQIMKSIKVTEKEILEGFSL